MLCICLLIALWLRGGWVGACTQLSVACWIPCGCGPSPAVPVTRAVQVPILVDK